MIVLGVSNSVVYHMYSVAYDVRCTVTTIYVNRDMLYRLCLCIIGNWFIVVSYRVGLRVYTIGYGYDMGMR